MHVHGSQRNYGGKTRTAKTGCPQRLDSLSSPAVACPWVSCVPFNMRKATLLIDGEDFGWDYLICVV